MNPDTEQVGYHAQRVTKEQAARAEALVRRMCPDPEPILAALGLVAVEPAPQPPRPAFPPGVQVCKNGHKRTPENTRMRMKDGRWSKDCLDCRRDRYKRNPPTDPGTHCRNGHLRTEKNTNRSGPQVRCKECRRQADRERRRKQREQETQ